MKKINSAAIVALKHALSNIYWYKNDLKSFLNATIKNKAIISYINWNDTKINCVSFLVDSMVKNEGRFQEDLLSLMEQVCNFNTFSHFDKFPNSLEMKDNAIKAVLELRKSCKGWFDSRDEKDTQNKVKENYNLSIKKSQDHQQRLLEFKQQYIDLSMSSNVNSRGYLFEKFLKELFMFFDLDPRGSFKIDGEQIDGSFSHEGTDYLIEAKWQNHQAKRADLDIFSAKIGRKLKTTLGLFISVNGYVETIVNGDVKFNDMILMDSIDLLQILDNRIALPEMIKLKRKHASETGEIMYRVQC